MNTGAEPNASNVGGQKLRKSGMECMWVCRGGHIKHIPRDSMSEYYDSPFGPMGINGRYSIAVCLALVYCCLCFPVYVC